MKLLFCGSCHDIFNLRRVVKSCTCGQVKGQYKEDGDSVWITGKRGILLGLSNREFALICMRASDRGDLFLYPVDNGKVEIR